MLAKKRIITALFCSAIGIALFAAIARQSDAYRQVTAKDLIKNLQFYWAQGIVFKDTIVEPPSGPPKQMDERTVVTFRTKIVGECFATESAVPALQNLKAGTECVFSGTVFQEAGWFSSKFHVLVQDVAPSATNISTMRAAVSNLAVVASNNAYASTARQLDLVLSHIQAELLTYSSAHNIPMSELLDPKCPQHDDVMAAVRNGIGKLEEDSRAPSSVFLTELLLTMLAGQNAQPRTMPQPATASTNREIMARPTGETTPEQRVEKQTTADTKDAGEKSSAPTAQTNLTPAVSTPSSPVQKKEESSFFSRLFGTGEKSTATPPARKEAALRTNTHPRVVTPTALQEKNTTEIKPAEREMDKKIESPAATPAKVEISPEAKTITPVSNQAVPQGGTESKVTKPADRQKGNTFAKPVVATETTIVKKAAPPQQNKPSFFAHLFGSSSSTNKTDAPKAKVAATNQPRRVEVQPKTPSAPHPEVQSVPQRINETNTIETVRQKPESQHARPIAAVTQASVKKTEMPQQNKPSFFARLFESSPGINKTETQKSKVADTNQPPRAEVRLTVPATPSPADQPVPQGNNESRIVKSENQRAALAATKPPPPATTNISINTASPKQDKPSFFARLFGSSTDKAEAPKAKVAHTNQPPRAEVQPKSPAAPSPADLPVPQGGNELKNREPIDQKPVSTTAKPAAPVQAVTAKKTASLEQNKLSFFARLFGSNTSTNKVKEPKTKVASTNQPVRFEIQTKTSSSPADPPVPHSVSETRIEKPADQVPCPAVGRPIEPTPTSTAKGLEPPPAITNTPPAAESPAQIEDFPLRYGRPKQSGTKGVQQDTPTPPSSTL